MEELQEKQVELEAALRDCQAAIAALEAGSAFAGGRERNRRSEKIEKLQLRQLALEAALRQLSRVEVQHTAAGIRVRTR